MTLPVVATFAAVVGACIGSFLNVCIARWPAGMSVVSPPSRCPRCERPIRSYENVPILGWIALRGRCAGCKERISVQYPLVELVVALVWTAIVWHYGVTLTALRVAVFVTLLLGVAVTDAKHYLIPDGFTLFGVVWTLGTAFVAVFVRGPSPFAVPYEALIGMFTGAGAIAVTGWLGEVMLKREAMGFGDVTLMAVAGAALGPQRVLLTVFIAAALGAVIFLGVVYPVLWLFGRRRGEKRSEEVVLPLVPFGVFLAPAAVVALFAGDAMIRWYTAQFLGT